MTPRTFSLLIAAPLAVGFLSAKPPAEHGHHPKPNGVSSLDVVTHGTNIDLLTGSSLPDTPTPVLQHQRSTDGGTTWSSPIAVGKGQPGAHGLNRGMDAQIASYNDQLVAVWMTPGTDAFGGGPMATALSSDGGKTWTAGPNPADDGSTDGHGFIDVAAGKDGVFHVTWLDSRHEQRGLRYARSTDGGRTWSANVTLDKETCECCWNTIVTGKDGSVGILYRDKSPRDMALVFSEDNGLSWAEGSPVGAFDWKFDGCPHVGGGLQIELKGAERTLHAAVWTGQEGKSGIYHVSSGENSNVWQEPESVAPAESLHPDLAIGTDGRVALAWTSLTDGKTVIAGAISTPEGESWKPMAITSAKESASHPRILSTGKGFRVFWTQKNEHGVSEWRSAAIP